MAPSSEVREGVDVSLRCDVPGEPAPGTTFSWYKDGALVHDGPDGVMELPRVASAAAGSYHCNMQAMSLYAAAGGNERPGGHLPAASPAEPKGSG